MRTHETPRPGDHSPIIGPHDVLLRPVADADVPDLLRWLSDPEVVAFYGDPPASLDDCRAEYLEPDVNPCWRFVVEWNGRPVGEIQYGHRYAGEEYAWDASVDIFIGEPDARSRGVGTEAIRTMLRHHAFEHGEYVDAHFMTLLEGEWPAARNRWFAERGAL
ncbi:MAG: N-acetyltransferase [Dehalococcoidia bacterium]|nr:N-acetyltransferase [Dehalococcoidia bacterium]